MSTANRPFFIVGSGRSGTTLLRLILDAHSRLAIPPESWILLPLIEHLPLTAELSSSQVEEAVTRVTEHYRWPDLEIDDAWFEEQVRALESPRIRTIADVVFERVRERSGVPRWGDKTPRYVGIVPEIARLYPEAQFIHLMRDGRDVVLSMWLRRWFGNWLVWNLDEWRDAMDFMERNRAVLPAERLLEVRYEDLVLDTEATVRRICAFLGESFEPSMMQWEDSVAAKIPGRELYIHQKLLRRPRPDDVARWKRELHAGQVFMLEAYLGRRLEQQGYEPRFASPAWAPLFWLARVGVKLGLPALDVVTRAPGALWRRVKWGLGVEERPGPWEG